MNDETFGAGDAAVTSSVTVSVTGRFKGKPEIRLTKDSRDFATATVIVNAKPGQPTYYRVLAFGDETRTNSPPPAKAASFPSKELWTCPCGKTRTVKRISVTVIASRVMCLELTPIKNDRSPASVASKRIASSTPSTSKNAPPGDDDDTEF